MADNTADRSAALEKILPYQTDDFVEIFRVMEGLPVTIRLLDPPLHEFLPHEDAAVSEMASELNLTVEEVKQKVNGLKEMNPMLGHRGCRLGITYNEIYDVQVRAIFDAAVIVVKEGKKVIPEVMIPLTMEKNELEILTKRVKDIANSILSENNIDLNYLVGTMLEIPRAVLLADEIAEQADFFSFGTNDLTQMTFGISRDDSGRFLPEYVEKGILKDDPFQVLDQKGIGRLIEFGLEKARAVKPDIKIGICGEHGGESQTVQYCHSIGFDYVSCSPYRVPVARLAAAHAVAKQSL